MHGPCTPQAVRGAPVHRQPDRGPGGGADRQARELKPEARRLWRQQHTKPVVDALHTWLTEQRQKLAKADAPGKQDGAGEMLDVIYERLTACCYGHEASLRKWIRRAIRPG